MSETVLIVCAHPDDETLGAGGTIARLTGEGYTVYVATATDGVGARLLLTDELDDVQKRRDAEFVAALDVLGARAVRGKVILPDNGLDTVPLLNLVQSVEALVDVFRPSTVYTHHLGDLNVDHQLIARAVATATRPYPGQVVKRVYAFEVPESTGWAPPGFAPFVPTRYVALTAEQLETKREALECYKSEARELPHPRAWSTVESLAMVRGSQCGHYYAEAFTVVREIVS